MNICRRVIFSIIVAGAFTPSVTLSLQIPVEYPEYALENCVEGFVQVQYTYSSEGQPKNIEILESSPVGVFEDATRKNLSYWRYPDRAGETEIKTVEFKLGDNESCNS